MAACHVGEAGGNGGRRRLEGRCCLFGAWSEMAGMLCMTAARPEQTEILALLNVLCAVVAASNCRRLYCRRPASSGHWTPSQHLQCLTFRRRLILPSTLAGHAPKSRRKG